MAKFQVEISKTYSRTIKVEANSEEEAKKVALRSACDYTFWAAQPQLTARIKKQHNLLDEQIENKLRELKFFEIEGIFWRVNDDRSKGVIYDSHIRFMRYADEKTGWELETYPDLIKTLNEYGIKC